MLLHEEQNKFSIYMDDYNHLLQNFGLSKNEILAMYSTVGTKHRVYLVFELYDCIHIAARQLEVQKKLGNDSQNQ